LSLNPNYLHPLSFLSYTLIRFPLQGWIHIYDKNWSSVSQRVWHQLSQKTIPACYPKVLVPSYMMHLTAKTWYIRRVYLHFHSSKHSITQNDVHILWKSYFLKLLWIEVLAALAVKIVIFWEVPASIWPVDHRGFDGTSVDNLLDYPNTDIFFLNTKLVVTMECSWRFPLGLLWLWICFMLRTTWKENNP
jgi:hypothetical protein